MKETFGEYIRSLRNERGLPIRKVAAFLDIDQSSFSKIERSERLKFADDIIENERKTSINVLKKKILQLHETYLELHEKILI